MRLFVIWYSAVFRILKMYNFKKHLHFSVNILWFNESFIQSHAIIQKALRISSNKPVWSGLTWLNLYMNNQVYSFITHFTIIIIHISVCIKFALKSHILWILHKWIDYASIFKYKVNIFDNKIWIYIIEIYKKNSTVIRSRRISTDDRRNGQHVMNTRWRDAKKARRSRIVNQKKNQLLYTYKKKRCIRSVSKAPKQ